MRRRRDLPPVWSQAILDELAYTLTRLLTLKDRTKDEVDAYVTRLRNQMRHAFPDALTTGWDRRHHHHHHHHGTRSCDPPSSAAASRPQSAGR